MESDKDKKINKGCNTGCGFVLALLGGIGLWGFCSNPGPEHSGDVVSDYYLEQGNGLVGFIIFAVLVIGLILLYKGLKSD